jgi:Zn finger protein HypA/HybF involved in hydrogenase expression
MEFKYKCPVCRASNILTANNLYCRRCKSNLTSIYMIKKKKVFKVIKKVALL